MRQTGVAVELTDRDLELIRALARLRVAPTSGLVRLYFGGVRRDTAARRLRRLFDAGFLSVRAALDPTAESLYVLGPKGRQIVRQDGEGEARVPRGGLDHHLAIVDTWVALATLDLPGVELRVARADWELRAEFAGQLVVVPDLFAILSGPGGEQALAVEVDLGTEPLKVLRAKLAAYGRLAAIGTGLLGLSEFALGLAVRGPGRLPFLRDLLAASWAGPSILWCIEAGPAAEVSRLMLGQMTPLAPSPCGKGRDGSPSPCEERAGDA